MNVTLSMLRQELAYPNVEERRTHETVGLLWWKRRETYHEFRILPSKETEPAVRLLFGVDEGDEEECTLQHVALGDWHGHFEAHDDEALNVEDALDMVNKLITGELCLLVTRDGRGRYTCGQITRSDEAQRLVARSQGHEAVLFNV